VTERPARKEWSWPVRILFWLYNFFVGPFLTKLRDGTIMGSMTRWAVALFVAAEVYRLVQLPVGLATWPEAFIAFCVLFALPIDGALSRLAERDPEAVVRAVTGMFGKPAEGATVVADTVVDTGHQWASGAPDEGVI